MASAKSQEDVKPGGTLVQLDAAVFGATVQLPAFDRVEPKAWFAVADANFALRKVTDSNTRYYYLLSKLDSMILRKLATFLAILRGSDPYQEIKDKLCRAYEPPLEQKIDAFLATRSIWDECPSEFAMELQRLAGKATMDDMFKRVFIRSLPPSLITAITPSLSASFEVVVDAADRAWTAAASVKAQAVSISEILGAPVNSGTRGSKRGGRQRGQKANRGFRMSVQVTNVGNLCSFHRKFGDSAKKCASGLFAMGRESSV